MQLHSDSLNFCSVSFHQYSFLCYLCISNCINTVPGMSYLGFNHADHMIYIITWLFKYDYLWLLLLNVLFVIIQNSLSFIMNTFNIRLKE